MRFEVASAAEWPYRLSAAFTCAQDDPVAFTPAAGVTCHVAGGSLCVDVAPGVGPGEHTYVVTRADGTSEGRRVAIVAY